MNISNFSELLSFIENTNISIQDIAILLKETIDLHIIEYKNKDALINDLKTFWNKYGESKELPLFMINE